MHRFFKRKGIVMTIKRRRFLKRIALASSAAAVAPFTILKAGPAPSDKLNILGVGIGGTMEKAALIAKRSLLREIGRRHPDPAVARLELDLLEALNDLGIGPQGLGGRITALDVHVETYPTHIASIPVAVNLQCHCARHKEAVI